MSGRPKEDKLYEVASAPLPRQLGRGCRKHSLLRENRLENLERLDYEKPEIMETFEASEVLGTAAGYDPGMGSHCDR
jgi:hypothetical protein